MKSIYSLVGMKYHAGAKEALRKMKDGASLTLVRDPTNAVDTFAIKVTRKHDGAMLGYIKAGPEQMALAREMDKGDATMPARLRTGQWPQVEIDSGEPELF